MYVDSKMKQQVNQVRRPIRREEIKEFTELYGNGPPALGISFFRLFTFNLPQVGSSQS